MYPADNGVNYRQDPNRREKSIYPTDQSQVLTASYYYELPVGRSKHFLSNLSGAANKALGDGSSAACTATRKGILSLPPLPTACPSSTRRCGRTSPARQS